MMSFIRSNLRKMSMKWPPKSEALKAARRPAVNPKRNQKWEYQCSSCGKWKTGKEVQADHRIPCGSLKDFSEAGDFLKRMLVEKEGYDIKCITCHKAKTAEERAIRRNTSSE